jgi:glutamyl-tRNA synthetase
MILGTDRSKLSKRHGAVSITEYREQGYLPETMVNFLALLGWSLDDRTEILSREELMANFSLERVSRTAAIFNLEKLNWMNGMYIRRLSPDDFTRRVLPFLDKGLSPQVKRPVSEEYVRQITPLIQERAKTLSEVPALTQFFFVDDLDYSTSDLIAKNMTAASTAQALEITRQRLDTLAEFTAESLEALLRPLAGELNLKASQLFSVLRTAVTGQTATPPLFQTMAVLGKERCLKRIDNSVSFPRNYRSQYSSP